MSNPKDHLLAWVGTTEEPLTIVTDNDGHTYIIRASEQGRFDSWVEYMENEDENTEWEEYGYNSIGCSLSLIRIVGEVTIR